jgi:hypothetical protein
MVHSSGWDFNCIVFSTNLFLRDWDVNPMPNPQPGGPGCLLVWNLTLDLSSLWDPANSCAAAGIALQIIGTRKPHRHKAETPPGGFLSLQLHINVTLETKRNIQNSCFSQVFHEQVKCYFEHTCDICAVICITLKNTHYCMCMV